MSIKTVQGSSTEQHLVSQMDKSFNSWAIVSLVMGGISLLASQTLDPGWGMLLLIIAVLSWKTRIPGMFAGYAVIMGWAAITNLLSGLSGGNGWWVFLGLMQIYWTFSIVMQLKKYRHLRLNEIYKAGNWPADLRPPKDEDSISRRFALASLILALSPWILPPAFLLAIFLYALAAQQSQPPEIVIQSLDQPAFNNLTQIFCSGTLAMPVLALALGIAALVSKTSKKKLAIGGVITSAIFLILLLAFMLIVILMPPVYQILNN